MTDKLFGGLTPKGVTEALMMWKWADQHPILFTLIEVSTAIPFVVLVYFGFKLIGGLIRRGTN